MRDARVLQKYSQSFWIEEPKGLGYFLRSWEKGSDSQTSETRAAAGAAAGVHSNAAVRGTIPSHQRKFTPLQLKSDTACMMAFHQLHGGDSH